VVGYLKYLYTDLLMNLSVQEFLKSAFGEVTDKSIVLFFWFTVYMFAACSIHAFPSVTSVQHCVTGQTALYCCVHWYWQCRYSCDCLENMYTWGSVFSCDILHIGAAFHDGQRY